MGCLQPTVLGEQLIRDPRPLLCRDLRHGNIVVVIEIEEALRREAGLALAEAGEDAGFEALNKVARRYSTVPPGVEAFRRAGAFARVWVFDDSAAEGDEA